MLVLVQVSSMKTRRAGIDGGLGVAPALAVAAYVRPVLLARDERLFLNVTPMRRKNRLITEVSALTPRSAEEPVAQRLQRYVGFLSAKPLSGAILAETGKKLGVDREKANIIREIA